jgi:teichuronic acid biosynthesis glycosyltransferase TuaG
VYSKGLVSIVTPCYNCGCYLQKTIDSVVSQIYTNWELLLVDDCSTDNTAEIIYSAVKRDSRIKTIRNNKNSGAAYSRNQAIAIANGEFLAFLDSDDIWIDRKLLIQISFMEKNKADFSFSEYELIDANGKLLGRKARIINHLTYVKMLCYSFAGCLTVIYRQDISSEKIYAPRVRYNEDLALFLEVLKKVHSARGIKEVLAYYRIHENSGSQNKIRMIKPFFEVLHDQQHINYFFCSILLVIHVCIKMIFRYKKN